MWLVSHKRLTYLGGIPVEEGFALVHHVELVRDPLEDSLH